MDGGFVLLCTSSASKKGLETKGQSHRKYVIEPQYKLWTPKAQVSFLGWQYFEHIVTEKNQRHP